MLLVSGIVAVFRANGTSPLSASLQVRSILVDTRELPKGTTFLHECSSALFFIFVAIQWHRRALFPIYLMVTAPGRTFNKYTSSEPRLNRETRVVANSLQSQNDTQYVVKPSTHFYRLLDKSNFIWNTSTSMRASIVCLVAREVAPESRPLPSPESGTTQTIAHRKRNTPFGNVGSPRQSRVQRDTLACGSPKNARHTLDGTNRRDPCLHRRGISNASEHAGLRLLPRAFSAADDDHHNQGSRLGAPNGCGDSHDGAGNLSEDSSADRCCSKSGRRSWRTIARSVFSRTRSGAAVSRCCSTRSRSPTSDSVLSSSFHSRSLSAPLVCKSAMACLIESDEGFEARFRQTVSDASSFRWTGVASCCSSSDALVLGLRPVLSRCADTGLGGCNASPGATCASVSAIETRLVVRGVSGGL